MATITLDQIHNDLEFIKQKISTIEEHMTDLDLVMTDEDIESLEKAEKDLKSGKTKILN